MVNVVDHPASLKKIQLDITSTIHEPMISFTNN